MKKIIAPILLLTSFSLIPLCSCKQKTESVVTVDLNKQNPKVYIYKVGEIIEFEHWYGHYHNEFCKLYENGEFYTNFEIRQNDEGKEYYYCAYKVPARDVELSIRHDFKDCGYGGC